MRNNVIFEIKSSIIRETKVREEEFDSISALNLLLVKRKEEEEERRRREENHF